VTQEFQFQGDGTTDANDTSSCYKVDTSVSKNHQLEAEDLLINIDTTKQQFPGLGTVGRNNVGH
jgi:hypothetical protein